MWPGPEVRGPTHVVRLFIRSPTNDIPERAVGYPLDLPDHLTQTPSPGCPPDVASLKQP
jgi:hypothetical protein